MSLMTDMSMEEVDQLRERENRCISGENDEYGCDDEEKRLEVGAYFRVGGSGGEEG